MADVWRIDGRTATCETPGFRAQLDLSSPREGLTPRVLFGVALPEAPAPYQILGVQAPGDQRELLAIEDCYARGGDLIVTYAQGVSAERRFQIYWRIDAGATPEVDMISIELQASVQTPRLDIDVDLWTRSTIRAGDVRPPTPSDARGDDSALCWIASRGESPIRYAEMVHPSDYRQSRCTTEGEATCLEHRLFADKLEKGVILRSRLRALFLSTPDWSNRIDDAWRQFVHGPPPLTA